ncbi:MAG: 4-hydroxy-tetrahydrodipicolinate reductase [Chitinivibrionales bacterium]|nr:4-hydroxy-tetrahydrodipicolinate reductase [Chitinivibrionales bacterium]MBD3397151.1 4-hydroxy-tetrahydrodipicolinate reductase [Chitinivibrionales bacterium]
MAVNIIIAGVLGRMGREIAAVALADPDTRLVGCTEAPSHEAIGKNAGALLGAAGMELELRPSMEALPVENSVIINFTSPDATCDLLRQISGRGANVVIGTTGLSAEQVALVNDYAREGAVVFSPNMGLGMNLLFHLTHVVASRLGEAFDIEIIEAHHRHKKDAPSGTAKRLGEIAAGARHRSYDRDAQHGRQGATGERPRGEIGMHAVRGGDIVGDHTVLFAGPGERLELKHSAQSRATFARGAVTAAKWLQSRSPGIYSMQDVLGL